MGRSRFVESEESRLGILERTLAFHPKVQAAILVKAEEAKKVAQGIVVAEHIIDTGAYLDSIEVDQEIVDGKPVTRVVARDFKANWIEFGTAKGFRARAVIRRACEAVGGKLSKRNVTR